MDAAGTTVSGTYCWPQGFWVDLNNVEGAPVIVNKNNPNYKFDKIVKNFYAESVWYLEQERTDHIFRNFGCDYSFVDASINYRVIDKLIELWEEFGFDKDIELKMSTPTRYLKQLKDVNKEFYKDKQKSWPIRRDDGFPFGNDPNQFMSGYYSSRSLIKKSMREVDRAFQSNLRMTTSHVLRQDLGIEAVNEILKYQGLVQEGAGTLIHHDAISGTGTEHFMTDTLNRAKKVRSRVIEFSQKIVQDKLKNVYNITTGKLDSGLKIIESPTNFTSEYAKEKEILMIVQNPSPQKRNEIIEF